MKKKYKVIVIGSGPGGSMATSILAKNGVDVLVLERGKRFERNEVKDFSSEELNQKYRNAGLTAAIGRRALINYAEADCLGGGSEINSGLYHTVPDQIIEEWEKKNRISIDRRALTEAFKEIENKLNISYLPKGNLDRVSEKLKKGSNNLNWSCDEIPRWFSYEDGVHKKGIKQSMSETLIPEYINYGADVLVSSKVIKIKKSKGNTKEVCVLKDGKEISFFSDFIFLAAGSIHTPFILKKSGLKRNVGKGLKMHPSFKFTALFPDEVHNETIEVPVYQVKEFSPDITLGCSLSTKPFLGSNLYHTDNLELLNEWKKMSNYYSMIKPQGVGNVHYSPLFSDPLVTFNLTKVDKFNIYKSIKLLARLLFESGATALFPSITNYKSIKNLRDLDDIHKVPLSKLNLMTIHLFSSVQIGGDSSLFPLNPEGALWQDPSIYVTDGSMLPNSPSVNPQATIMALAKINTDTFLSNLVNEF